jgi:hypothetical protein
LAVSEKAHGTCGSGQCPNLDLYFLDKLVNNRRADRRTRAAMFDWRS